MQRQARLRRLIRMPLRNDAPPSKFLKKELIGKKAKIASSANPDDVGRKGIIMDETLSTIEMFDGEKTRMFMKRNIVLEVSFGDDDVEIPGWLIELRPEDRIKKIKRNRVKPNG